MKKWCEEAAGGEKEKEPPQKKHQNLCEKLKKIGGQLTPVLHFHAAQDSKGGAQDSKGGVCLTVCLPVGASARQIAATVWELHQYNLPFAKMHRYVHHQHHHLLEDDTDMGIAGGSRRHVAASLMKHHGTIQRNHNAARAVSPASYGSSSMEIAPYNPAVTPTSSIEFRGGNGETGHTLKTSTELLKVLNRIWSLEEQHAANITLVKALKRELYLARSKIKEMARDRHEMEHSMKRITEDKQGHASATIHSVRDELEGERKLRKRSEALHRKLARELHETKASLTNALAELEKEKKSRVLLEDLCDEFAWRIKNYEQELHSLKHIIPDRGKGSNFKSTRDGMILHVSESWLDQRMQMKQETAFRKKSIAEQLSPEIKALIKAKQNSMQKLGPGSVTGPTARRRLSLESIPTNVAASAPPNDDDNVSSDGGDSPCFELHKPVARARDDIVNSKTKPDLGKKKLEPDSSSLQVKFEEQMAKAAAILDQEQGKKKTGEENDTKITEDEVGLNSRHLDSLLKSHHLLTVNESDGSSNKHVWKSYPSPVRAWTTTLPTEDDEVSESSKVQPESKEQTTLKSKLLEARTRGLRFGSRVKK